MTENTSLDDFVDAGDDQEVAEGESAERGDAGGSEADREGASAGDAASVDVESDAADSGDGTAAEAASEDDRPSPSAVEPATITYEWAPDGAACDACDDVVERRWRDEPGFVCESCKDW